MFLQFWTKKLKLNLISSLKTDYDARYDADISHMRCRNITLKESLAIIEQITFQLKNYIYIFIRNLI
jgi:hypothetical protein